MPCTRRIGAYLNDQDEVVLKNPGDGKLIELACGRCPDCQLRKARDWSIRIMHEAREHEQNCFLTLTYDNDHLPNDLSLNVRHWQLFAKRLRRRGIRFRYYHVGEYGGRLDRPHYHAALFGVDFIGSRKLWKVKDGMPLYTSPIIESAWDQGQHTIGDLTWESASYVARYMSKKEPGDADSKRYERHDQVKGESWRVKPEYATMSRGGRSGQKGIGQAFIEKFHRDIFKDDTVIMRGKAFPPPRYYSAQLKQLDAQSYEELTELRRTRSLRHAARSRDSDTRYHDNAREKATRHRVATNKTRESLR